MREPNKKYVYSLEDLTSEQKQQLLEKLIELDASWNGALPKEELFTSNFLYFSDDYEVKGEWLVSEEMYFTTKEIFNAKELFYTLENIQVDCRELSEDKIKEMADVFEKAGYKMYNPNNDLIVDNQHYFLSGEDGCFIVFNNQNKTTITYEKFIELFGRKEENFKKLVEVLNEELTEEAYKGTEYEVKYIAEKPKQYQIGIDTFERCEANMTKEEILACVRFNIDKYNWRNKGQDLEDLEKIISYANWAIKHLKK